MSMKKSIAAAISNACVALRNCQDSDNTEWESLWQERLSQLSNLLPSGAGLDAGTTISVDESGWYKITLKTSFHHMDEGGGYDGWTQHTVTVRASFEGVRVQHISGKDRNRIKDHLAELFQDALSQEAPDAPWVEESSSQNNPD